jgi:hypothetical protein
MESSPRWGIGRRDELGEALGAVKGAVNDAAAVADSRR